MYRIITNNQMCLVKYGDQIQVEYLDGQSYMDVLVKVRDYIQNGWCLETHPMTGSLKPNQTPYKSVMVSDRPVDKEEFYQQEITIENGITACRKFPVDPENSGLAAEPPGRFPGSGSVTDRGSDSKNLVVFKKAG